MSPSAVSFYYLDFRNLLYDSNGKLAFTVFVGMQCLVSLDVKLFSRV